MPVADQDLLLALGAYAQQVLVIVGDDGAVRVPPGQPRLLGFADHGDVSGLHLATYTHPDDLALVLAEMAAVEAGRSSGEPLVVRARAADGGWRWLEVAAFDARTVPAIEGVVLRLTLLPEARRPTAGTPATACAPEAPSAETSPPRSAGMESLAEALSAGVLAADGRGRVVYANRAAADLFERPASELIDAGWQQAVHPADLDQVRTTARAATGSAGTLDVTFRLMSHFELRWVHARFSGLGDPASRDGWVVVLHDITHQRALESDLVHRATHDPLTGLPNRLLLHDRLEQAIARLHRADDHVAVMFLDIDDFKSVNDTFGHAVGDATLVDLSARLQRTVRPGDTAARVGGDEFVLIADDVDETRALAIAHRVARSLAVPVPPSAQSTPAHEGRSLHITTSIGVALASPGQRVDEVLGLADQAMYRAKRGAQGQVVMAGTGNPQRGRMPAADPDEVGGIDPVDDQRQRPALRVVTSQQLG